MARGKKYPGVYERSDTIGKSFYYFIETKCPKTGNRKQKRYGRFYCAEDAYKDKIEKQAAKNKGTYIEPNKLTLKDWLHEWLDDLELSIKKRTLENYRYRVNTIVQNIGTILLYELNKEAIHDFYKVLKKQDKVVNGVIKKNIKLSSRTIYDTHNVLKMALSKAFGEGKIPRDVASHIKSPKVNKPKHDTLSPASVNVLLEVAKDDPFFCTYYLALYTGMRQAEILALTWGNVDFESKAIYILQTLDHEDDENVGITEGGKTTSSVRAIEMDDETIRILQKQKRKNEKDKLEAKGLYQENNLVCSTSTGTPINPSNLRRSLYRLLKKAEIDKVTYHELRHTFCTLMLKAGVPVKIVSEMAGHASTRVTQDTYTHVIQGMATDALKKYRQLVDKEGL